MGIKTAYEFNVERIKNSANNDVWGLKELKGFEKVFLKKGEEKEITFELEENELGFYNMNNEYVVEEGSFTIYIGEDSYSENKLTINYRNWIEKFF